MATIDDKVVAMSFESSRFESGVDKTLSSLDKLKKALQFPDAGKGLTAVASSAKEVDLGHISKGVDSISSKLGALRLTAIAVFANIASKALATGTQLLKSLTLGPAIQGFHEYETQINAVQTILSNTAAAGTGIKDVNKALDQLNKYADMTIYNFSEMTRNIGTFTAAGVDLKTSVASIKGIANLAAVSGSNAQQASTAMYQLSQAISAGSVKLQDWNSVVNAGMGGTVFQRALAQTAQHMGTLKKGAVELQGPMKNVRVNGESFRNSIAAQPGKEGWLSSKVLTETLKQLSGDMTDAQLKTQGYTDAQIKAIQAQAKMAVEAATRVKTLTQLISTTKEQLGSGWAQTWRIVFGDFLEARKMFTDVSNTFGDIIGASADARNKMLADWKKLGGRTVLIDSIRNAFNALVMVIKPIRQAFRDIFPPQTGKDLFELTKRFEEFTKSLIPSAQTMKDLKRTFRGVFAILDIGKQIIFGLIGVIADLFGVVGDGSGEFLHITGNIGDFLVKVDEALKKGDRLNKFFDGLGKVLSAPIKALGTILSLIGEIFSGGFSGDMDQMTKGMSPFQKAVEAVSKVLEKFLDLLGQIGEVVRPLVEAWVETISQIGPLITQALSNMNFEAILAVVRTGLLGGIFLMFKKFLGGGPFVQQLTKGFAGIGGGVVKNISGSFAALTGSLNALQQNIKAKTLKEIAIAVALLAASMVALSFVNPERLNSALGAITIAFGQLLAAMGILGNISKSLGFIKMPVIAATLIMLAGAIDILSIAVIALSFLSWEQLAKGLGAVGVLLVGLVAVTGPLSKGSAGMIKAGIGITAIAIALNLLALAVRQFGSMNLEQLGKGLGSVAVGLGIIVVAMRKMPTRGLIVAGAGLVAMGVGLNLIALAVRNFGSMNMREIAQGMGAIAIALDIIAVSMKAMPKGLIVQAAGLLLVAAALNGIALAVKMMGGMSIREIATGILGLAGALTVLALALKFMKTNVRGAVSLGIVAASVYLLATALEKLGAMSWKQIIKSLLSLAAAFVVIGVAGELITTAVPGLLGFGAAMFLIGAGLALAGAGIALIGTGLAALVVAAPTGFGVLLQAVVQFQQGLIENIKLLVLGLVEIVNAIADAAPKFVDAFVKILKSLLEAVIKASPMMVEAITALVDVLVKVLDENQDKIIQAGVDLLLALLNGIKKNIRAVVNSAIGIIVNFLKGIASNITKIAAAGAGILIALMKGVARVYSSIATTVIQIIAKFLGAIANNLPKIVTAGASIITKLLNAIANALPKVVTAGTNIIVKFIQGIGNAGPRIITAATNMIIKFINSLQQNANKLADAGGRAIVAFLNGIADTIDKRAPQIRRAGVRIGVAIVNGMIGGITSAAPDLTRKITDLMKALPKAAKKWLHISSPSAIFHDIGQNVVLGLANGMSDHTKAVDAATTMSNGVITTVKKTFQITSPSRVMQGIGRDVTGGFADGLRRGTSEDVKGAIDDLQTTLLDAIQDARDTLAEARKTRAEELAKKPKDRDKAAIKEAQQEIATQTDLIKRLSAGRTELIRGLGEEKKSLIAATAEHARLTEKLDEEQSKLDDLIQTRKDYRESIQEQYSDLPDVTPEDEEGKPVANALAVFTQNLATQVENVAKYAQTLQRLRGMGLDDETYKKLLAEGPSAQAFASQLEAAGPAAVKQIGLLSGQLETQAKLLGDKAASNLYDAGVKAKQGLVKGLTEDVEGAQKKMEEFVQKIVNAVKRKLKIKSPSQVFADIGKLTMEGMAKGVANSSKVVTDSINQVALDAVTSMQKTMQDIADVDPVITPILDLTQVESEAQKLASLTNTVPISAAVSYGQASAISAAQMQQAQVDAVAAAGGTTVRFEQNNYSPESLTEVEIYRQTKNQLSQLKSALALT